VDRTREAVAFRKSKLYFSPLLDDHQDKLPRHCIALFTVHLLYRPRHAGKNRNFHLHSFKDDNLVLFPHRISNVHLNVDYLPAIGALISLTASTSSFDSLGD